MKAVEIMLLAKLSERQGQLNKMMANWDGKDRDMEMEITQLEDEIDMLTSDLEEADED